jgi:hypothetical protein
MSETVKRPDRGEARYGAKGAASKTRKPNPELRPCNRDISVEGKR